MSGDLNDLLNTPPPPPGGERTNSNPKFYRVWAVNDPTTPMEYAKTLYESLFGVPGEETLKTIHEAGKALLGVFTLDLAETKVIKALIRSTTAGYEMKFEIEPEPESEQNGNPDLPPPLEPA